MTIIGHLPSEIQSPRRGVRGVMGRVYMGDSFRAHSKGDRDTARKAWWPGVRYDPAWLLNWGVLSMIVRTLVSRPATIGSQGNDHAQVSVVISTYNSAQFLPTTVESVLAQTFKDYELIVVDDGSTDNTQRVLEPYQGRLKYIYQENKSIRGLETPAFAPHPANMCLPGFG